MFKKIIFQFCLFLPFLISGQSGKADSLYKLFKKSDHDTSLAKLHYKIGSVYVNEGAEKDSVILHFKIAVSLFKKNKYNKFIVYINRDIGNYFINDGYPDSALHYFNISLGYLTDKSKGYIEISSGIGNCYFLMGNYIKAYSHYLDALKQAEISGTPKQKSKAYSNVGVILKEQLKYHDALPYFEKALGFAVAANEKKSIYITYVNIGNVYADLAKGTKDSALKRTALENYNKAKPIEHESGPGLRIATIMLYGNIGNLYTDLKQYDRAELEYNQAVRLMEAQGYFPQSALIYNNIAALYIEKKELKKAAEYLAIARVTSLKSGSPDNLAQMYQTFSKYYKLTGNYKNAYETHLLYKQYSDSIYNSDNSEKRKELELNFEFEKKEAVTKAIQERKEEIANKEKQKQLVILYAFIIGFILMVLLAFFIYKGLRTRQKANEIIEKQKNLVEEKQKEILDSIHYAQKIQQALLASTAVLNKNLQGPDNYFVFFKPKDIVSGDFYWATEHGDYFFLAVCDSTGHGVPGAFMSLLNIGFMSEAINENEITEPGEVFNYVRKRLITSISEDGQKDGFDGILLRINKKDGSLCYAASHNKPVFVSSVYTEMLCDKMPVGKGETETPFKSYSVDFSNGFLYLYTDGYADQFGGPKGKKFKYRPFNEMLQQISFLPVDKQKLALEDAFNQWKGPLEQVDDVLVIGIKLS